jgi:hypothetical protein
VFTFAAVLSEELSLTELAMFFLNNNEGVVVNAQQQRSLI